MLPHSLLEEIITVGISGGADYAEVFLEDNVKKQIALDNGAVESILSGQDYGCGIRLFLGTSSIYTFTNDLSRNNLLQLAQESASQLQGTAATSGVSLYESVSVNRNPYLWVPSSVGNSKKIGYLETIHKSAKAYSPEIKHVSVRHWEMDRKRTIATSDGLIHSDRSVYTRFFVKTMASNGVENQTGFLRPGALKGMEFYEEYDIEGCAREAAKSAVTLLHAGPAPTGVMPVVLANGNGAVFVHEAIGHSLESTAVESGNGAYSGKIGSQIANSCFNLVDDGTIPNGWGSLNIDDEGIAATRNVLIKDGILTGYMVDRLGSRRLGLPPTGAGRRQSYRFAPTSRMTNTMVVPGQYEDEEIIRSVDYGLFAKEIGGGTANVVTTDYNFNVLEAYMIRNGQICEPVRAACITGRASETLFEIDMVGKHLAFGQGMCGAASGSLPVDNGQPMLRIGKMTVGGRK